MAPPPIWQARLIDVPAGDTELHAVNRDGEADDEHGGRHRDAGEAEPPVPGLMAVECRDSNTEAHRPWRFSPSFGSAQTHDRRPARNLRRIRQLRMHVPSAAFG
ncbi:MAG TPA: hypothetical protein VNK41_10775 [Vicinamibacterales bacterium]|nr:hypothetical protein [Vicinamibacterales bacterium]